MSLESLVSETSPPAQASAAYLESRLKGTKFLKPSRASSGDAASNRSANNRNSASNNNNNKTVRMEQERAGLGTWKVGEGLEKSGKDEVFEEEGDFEKAMKKSASTDKLVVFSSLTFFNETKNGRSFFSFS